ncbi:MAG: ABC transporter permease [Gammaproteobacteria bacterium]|nr:MAG: ABC transporter permease [Gammaproteobacteria bacterium]
MVVYWTDGLIFFLVIMIVLLGWRTAGKEHLRRPWRKVAENRMGMVSLVVLLFFVTIGLLDSVHFYPDLEEGSAHQSNEAISLFDEWVTPIRVQDEKSYSAPFANRLFAKEMVELTDGQVVWDYPRLHYGGAHLHDESRKTADIIGLAGKGMLHGLAIWLLAIPLIYFLKQRTLKGVGHNLIPIFKGETVLPLRAIALTFLFLSILTCSAAELALHYHIFGTDKVGQDVFYQALKSIRTGLMIGTLTTLVMLPLALSFGILAGFFRGWVDDLIQYLYTTLSSIPGVLLIAASILMMQVYMANNEEQFASLALRADMRLLFLCLILGITSWTGLCRLLRAETLKLREMEYVQAATAMGVRRSVILVRHILPNLFHIVLISVVLDFSALVLAEAVLSYVNIGVDPTTNSWGNMINSARLEMAREPVVWWSLAAAFTFMFTLVLAANLFADSVRDAFDPRRAAD